MRVSKAIRKYLTGYAEAEISIADRISAVHDYALVIPARAEKGAFLEGIWPAVEAAPGSVLTVVVVNGRVTDSEDVHSANRVLLGELERMRGRALLVIDRASPGKRLPEHEGVGLARRIGADVALALHAQGKLRVPWIYMTDADACLPGGYFAVRAPPAAAAFAYPFWHENADRAMVLYELWLRYYVLGLRWAGSPYAHHSVGSTMAVHCQAYAAVRGMPRRQAGEDFYMLNKVAKLGRVVRPGCRPIRLQTRGSTRVPFGTGPAWLRIRSDLEKGVPYKVVHPECFVRLRAHLKNASGPRFHERFDAFRTFKFIRAQRAQGLPEIPWNEAMQAAEFVPPATDLACLRKALFQAEAEA